MKAKGMEGDVSFSYRDSRKRRRSLDVDKSAEKQGVAPITSDSEKGTLISRGGSWEKFLIYWRMGRRREPSASFAHEVGPREISKKSFTLIVRRTSAERSRC